MWIVNKLFESFRRRFFLLVWEIYGRDPNLSWGDDKTIKNLEMLWGMNLL